MAPAAATKNAPIMGAPHQQSQRQPSSSFSPTSPTTLSSSRSMQLSSRSSFSTGQTYIKFSHANIPKSYPSHCHLYFVEGNIVDVDRNMEGNVFVSSSSNNSSEHNQKRAPSSSSHTHQQQQLPTPQHDLDSTRYLSVLQQNFAHSITSVHEIHQIHNDLIEQQQLEYGYGAIPARYKPLLQRTPSQAAAVEAQRSQSDSNMHFLQRTQSTTAIIRSFQERHESVSQYQLIDVTQINHQLGRHFNLFGRFCRTHQLSQGASNLLDVKQLNFHRQCIDSHQALTIQQTQNPLQSSHGCPKTIRLFYFIPRKHSFDKCVDHLKKLAFGMELIQLFFYHTLRNCFALEEGWASSGSEKTTFNQRQGDSSFHASKHFSSLHPSTPVEIHIIQCSKSKKELNELGDQWNLDKDENLEQVFHYFRDITHDYIREVLSEEAPSTASSPFVNLMFLGMTRFSKSLKKNIGHTFSQEGNFALLSTYALDLWPSSEQDVEMCFTNQSALNPKKTVIDPTALYNARNSSDHGRKSMVSAWENLTYSFARVIQTTAATFDIAQHLIPLTDLDYPDDDDTSSNGSAALSNSVDAHLLIHHVNRFFTSSTSPTFVLHQLKGKAVQALNSYSYWNKEAASIFRKTVMCRHPVDSMKPALSEEEDDIHSVSSNTRLEPEKASLPTIRSRSVLSAVREEGLSNLSSSVSNLPKLSSNSNIAAGTGMENDHHAPSEALSSVDQPQSKLPSHTALTQDIAPSAGTRTTSYWEYDSGYFKQSHSSKKRWKEYHHNESRHHSVYDQINMTDTYVLLFNPMKQVYMCLDGVQCRFSRDGENFQLLHLGTFRNRADAKLHQKSFGGFIRKKKKKHASSKKLSHFGNKWRSKEDKSSYFQRTDANEQGETYWIEYRNQHAFSKYREDERSDDFVILKDEDSGMLVKLQEGESFWRYDVEGSGWESLSHGLWCRGAK